jgi:hypothetical protein
MDDFDLDYNEVSDYNAAYKQEPRSLDRRICICGHAMSRHHFNNYEGSHFCKPGQLACPCINPRPVIEVPNTRYFMRKSHGSGAKHALPRGIVASIEALGEDEFNSKRKWLVDPVCDICKEETKYYPVRVTPTGEAITDDAEDQGVTAFMCSECR